MLDDAVVHRRAAVRQEPASATRWLAKYTAFGASIGCAAHLSPASSTLTTSTTSTSSVTARRRPIFRGAACARLLESRHERRVVDVVRGAQGPGWWADEMARRALRDVVCILAIDARRPTQLRVRPRRFCSAFLAPAPKLEDLVSASPQASRGADRTGRSGPVRFTGRSHARFVAYRS